jgi:hypothetical protein
MVKSKYFKVFGESLLFLFFLGTLIYIGVLVYLLRNNPSNFLPQLLYFLLYLVFTPTFSLLLISHAKLMDTIDLIQNPVQPVEKIPNDPKLGDWICDCGTKNRKYVDTCLSCGKKAFQTYQIKQDKS